MKLELNPATVAAQIVAEIDRKGSGLSNEHENQIGEYIIRVLKSHEVKKTEKTEK